MVILQGCWEYPQKIGITDDYTVDVWRGIRPSDVAENINHERLLSSEEKERSEKFVYQKDRDLFIFSHGMLRNILAGYTGCSPIELQFTANAYGKPSLVLPAEGQGLHFNLTHSRDVVLLAVTRKETVGVDVEYLREINDVEQLSERYFSESERAYLRRLPPKEQLTGFFQCWVLKESYIKAIGMGLIYPLDKFSVSLSQTLETKTILCDSDIEIEYELVAQLLDPQPNYSAAVTFSSFINVIRCFSYESCSALFQSVAANQ